MHLHRKRPVIQSQFGPWYIIYEVFVDDEVPKAIIAETFGADTISDLSMGGGINAIRKEIFSHTTLPITTVPIYQTGVENCFKKDDR